MAKLTGVQIEGVAARASVSTKSVRRYLAGEELHPNTRRRVEGALREEGHGGHVRTAGEQGDAGQAA